MSHYSLLVVGTDIQEQMAPFDENNTKREDLTNEYMNRYKTDEITAVKDHDGNLFKFYDNRFWQKLSVEDEDKCEELIFPTYGYIEGLGHVRTRYLVGGGSYSHVREKMVMPKDHKEVTVHPCDLFTFNEYVLDYCGVEKVEMEREGIDHQALVDASGNVTSVIGHVNPNAKWDWYTIGGRFAGRLILKGNHSNLRNVWYTVHEHDVPVMRTMNMDGFSTVVTGKGELDFTIKPNNELKEGDVVILCGVKHTISSIEPYGETTMVAERVHFKKTPVCYGILRNGVMVDRTDFPEDWEERYHKMVAEIPYDALVTVVDYHS